METDVQPVILNQLSALADSLRSRLLLLLERHELTVTELCSVLQLPQSTVSRHLKTLADGGWVVSRPEGTRRLYRVPVELSPPADRLWSLTREEVARTAQAAQDARRVSAVLAQRRSRSREFFAAAADRWDQMRDDLFGPRFYLLGLIGLLNQDWTVADLGCGTGPVAEALAPAVGRVIAVDGSQEMLSAAGRRLSGHDNVELRQGELEALPIDDGQIDAATLILVLHHLPDAGKVVSEVVRVLRPGGKLLIVDMLPHNRQEYRQEMGHIWMGFTEEQILRLLENGGLTRARFHALPDEAAAGGPTLFAATAVAPGQS